MACMLGTQPNIDDNLQKPDYTNSKGNASLHLYKRWAFVLKFCGIAKIQ